jgi:hypothetical protein
MLGPASPLLHTLCLVERRFVALYCASGPYRHVRRLIEEMHAQWLPWGYRMPALRAKELDVQPGDKIELWEVDNTRQARTAIPLAVALVDYVAVSDDYLALTLMPSSLPMLSNQAQVLAQARSRRFVEPLESFLSSDGEPLNECPGNGRHQRPIQDGAAFQSSITTLPVGR